MPPGRYIYGETETSLGTLGVHGLCIPWADAHVRTGNKDRQRWQDHVAYLAALPSYLERPSCDLQLLTGDFNQRFPRKRAPADVHQALLNVLSNRFTVVTTGVIMPISKQTIDHVAVNNRLQARSIQSISNIGPDGRNLSDHFGITAEISLNSSQ